MNRLLLPAALLTSLACVPATAGEFAKPAEGVSRGPTTEYVSATGRPLGSVTRIGGVTYFAGADGRLLGTAETVDGRKVYKSY